MKYSVLSEVTLVCVLLASITYAADMIAVGVGSSSAPDAKAAGAEAAKKAIIMLGGTEAKIVVVFSARRQMGEDLVAGVGSVFDRAIIYGCEGYSPLTLDGNFPDQGHDIRNGVAVMALGGGIAVSTASEPVEKSENREKSFFECGRRIGGQLKHAANKTAKGKMVVTFGNQHAGDNKSFVRGFTEGLGLRIPIAGAAAGGDAAKEIVKGKIVTGMNVAFCITGDFNTGVGLSGGQGDLVAKTEESMSAALKAAGGKPVLSMVFDCGGRRGQLVKNGTITAEHDVMKKLAGVTPLFGFYGGGEIGTSSAAAEPEGVGFSVASAVLSVDVTANIVARVH